MARPFGFKHTEETKRKIADSHKGIYPSLETRKLLSEMRKEKIKKGEVKCFGHGLSPSFPKEKNSHWLGGITQQNYPKEFNEQLREYIRKRDSGVCQMCFKTEKKPNSRLHIHHINYIKSDCSERNLISLCQRHHSLTHTNREFYERLFSYIMTLRLVRGNLPIETTQAMSYYFNL